MNPSIAGLSTKVSVDTCGVVSYDHSMQASKIRELCITDEPRIVVAAFFEKTITAWSWEAFRQLGEFKSVFSFGGRRLALTPDGRICIAGGWGRGLSAYSIPDGRELWHTKGIHKIQDVSVSNSGQEVYCGVDTNSVHVLSTENGAILNKIGRASRVVSSPFDSRQLIVKRDRYLVQGETRLEIQAASFALHTAAFSPENVCLSEPKAGNRCIDLLTGKLLWHHKTLHFSHAVFNVSDRRFYCVTGFETDPYEHFLVRLAPHLEECEIVADLGRKCWAEAFTPSGKFLVASTGDIYETASGTIIGHLEFLQTEYPDPPSA